MKIIIHPTWACQFHCPYCSIHAQGLEKDTRTLSWRRWAWWIRQLPLESHIEISGGEPTLYADLIPLLQTIAGRKITWGLTTNAAHMSAVVALAEAQVEGCLALNVSIQPESPPDIMERAKLLREAGYLVYLNWVDHPDSPPVPDELGFTVNRIPYQAWLEGDALDGKRRMCTAGATHLCCDPAGRVYRCLVHLQLGLKPLGRITTSPRQMVTHEARLCETGCSTCYTDNLGAWHIKMKEI